MGLCFSSTRVVSGSNCKQTNRKPNSTTKTETVTLTETLTLLSLQAAPLPTLPFDLVAEILCRIPVKLLIQLRCLCKCFNSLISDPKFAEKHLRLSTKHRHLMLCSWNNPYYKFFVYDFPIHSVFSTSSVTQTQLTYPISLKSTYGAPLAVCSCAGILCLTMRQGSAVLWNPFIGMFKILPTLNNRVPFYPLYSFGYDQKESYQYISQPVSEMSLYTLGVLKDCLFFSASNIGDMFLGIWVMMEYGNKESWAKLYHVPFMVDPGLGVFIEVLHVYEDDQLLLDFYELGSNEKKLVVYGSKTGTFKIHKIQNADRRTDSEVFLGSLISPCS
ncbi:putative F-box protein At1g47790 [Medicago truncatula]|uniref:putative F-box protein At1g47790 n=1 Tax=Medicago truncatula TaxID=3880 RepID=UPI0019676676|nr:putative F-box protein At1g47790 [Medicago truncatula]